MANGEQRPVSGEVVTNGNGYNVLLQGSPVPEYDLVIVVVVVVTRSLALDVLDNVSRDSTPRSKLG